MALSLLRVWQPQVTSWDSWHAPPDCLRQEVLRLRSNVARHEHPVLQPQLSPAPSEGRGPGLSLVRVQEPHGLLFPCLCHSKASPPSLHQPFPLRMTCRLWKENVGVRRPWRCLQCHPKGGDGVVCTGQGQAVGRLQFIRDPGRTMTSVMSLA